MDRIKEKIIPIDYNSTYEFFRRRSEKFDSDNPYVVTMYQDNKPELVNARDKYEKEVIIPQLLITKNCSVLDIGCGVGRWAENVEGKADKYLGTDFSIELLQIAEKRIETVPGKLMFQQVAAQDIGSVENLLVSPPFNRFIISGVLIYINDEDVFKCFESILKLAADDSIVYIREPIGIDIRLTLNKFYSNELNDNYNAVYRTRQEYRNIFEKTFLKEGFQIKKEEFLFDDKLANRKETSQYYFILERKAADE